MKYSICWIIIFFLGKSMQAQDIQGDWRGYLPSAAGDLEIIFHFENINGILTTIIDVPSQGALGLPIEKTKYTPPQLELQSESMQINYKAQCTNLSINGNFTQNNQVVMLQLSRFTPELPGIPELVSSEMELAMLAQLDKGDFRYEVGDYFSKPEASSFQISPDGRFLSYKEKDISNKRHIMIKEIATGKTYTAVEEKEELIKDYGWINNERIYFMMDNGGDENYHIYSSTWQGEERRDLTPFEGITASIITLLKDQKDFMIISMNKNNKQIFEPYKLNVVTGDITQLFENKDITNPIQDFIFDKDGELRGYSKMLNGVKTELFYKDLASGNSN